MHKPYGARLDISGNFLIKHPIDNVITSKPSEVREFTSE